MVPSTPVVIDYSVGKVLPSAQSSNAPDRYISLNLVSKGLLSLMFLERYIAQWCPLGRSLIGTAISLSGGCDSLALFFSLRQLGIKAQPLCVQLVDDENDESDLVRNVLSHLGIKGRFIPVSRADIIGALPAMYRALDSPYSGGLLSWFVYKNCTEKVIFNGIGGDELFGQYNRYESMISPRQNLAALRRLMSNPSLDNLRSDFSWLD